MHIKSLTKPENLIDLLPGNVYMINPDNVYQNCNLLQARSLGFNQIKDVVGKTNKEMPIFAKHPHLAQILDSNNLIVMQNNTPQILEFEEKAPYLNGEIGIFKSYKLPLFDDNQKLIGILGISHDITQLKKEFINLKDKLEEKELALDNILANLPGHIYWTDTKNHFLGCNNQQAYDFGLSSRHEIIGLSTRSFQTEENADILIRNNNHVMSTGDIVIDEEPFKNSQNQIRIYMSQKSPLKNKHGKTLGVLGISLDVTEKIDALNQKTALEKAKAEAETQLRQIIAMYADAISHNLLTPLNTLAMISNQQAEVNNKMLKIYEEAQQLGLKSCNSINDCDLEYLNNHHSNKFTEIQKRMKSTIHDNITNLRNAVNIHLGNVSEIKLVGCEIIDSLGSNKLWTIAKGKNINLIHQHTKYNFKYLGNEIAMDQVVLNLVQNAFYQINKNGMGEIFITTEDGGEFNLLKIKDTAGGASPEVVKKMFNFNFTTKSDGSGVGLSFCKTTMNLFGGDIIAKSVEGVFMEFILSFPKNPDFKKAERRVSTMSRNDEGQIVVTYNDGTQEIVAPKA